MLLARLYSIKSCACDRMCHRHIRLHAKANRALSSLLEVPKSRNLQSLYNPSCAESCTHKLKAYISKNKNPHRQPVKERLWGFSMPHYKMCLFLNYISERASFCYVTFILRIYRKEVNLSGQLPP